MSAIEVNKIYNENNLETMARMPDNSVDAIVTDPPYGLGKEPDAASMIAAWLDHGYLEVKGKGFMGKEWDAFVPQPRFWKEAMRILKPGGHVLSFFGTRTYDWGVLAMRLAGFEVRDCLMWVYGSGFPKSHNISKAIDKAAGVEREVVGRNHNHREFSSVAYEGVYSGGNTGASIITAPATPEAQKWNGWGSALKPAFEPIVLARKPLGEKTIAANVLKWGTGGINVDGCRVEAEADLSKNWNRKQSVSAKEGRNAMNGGLNDIDLRHYAPSGRWPANFTHDGSPEVLGLMPETQSGFMAAGTKRKNSSNPNRNTYARMAPDLSKEDTYADSGSAARFFYCAKASKKDRNFGLPEGMKNTHPTVKPLKLIRWLVRLITPPGGLVYDPFVGSGTTLVACKEEGFDFIGSEMEEKSFEIATMRV